MALPEAVLAHYEETTALTNSVMRKVLRAWSQVQPRAISETWVEHRPQVLRILETAQYDAAFAGAMYGVDVLAQAGDYVAPDYFTNPRSLVGYSSNGAPLGVLLDRPVSLTKQLIEQGVDVGLALQRSSLWLANMTRTQIPDAARIAAGLDVATRPGVGFVRMVGGSACDRCVVLAGRFYRWNTGFLRHPRCNCRHVPTTAKDTAHASLEGYIDDPYEAFRSLSQAEQNRIYGADNAAAIRDGADIYQVVNAKRGQRGLHTTEGTTRRGFSSDLAGSRLTPEGIYAKKLSREETLQLLREHNYILEAGQVPGGSIVGQRIGEGSGALGRGGTRIGARTVVDRARSTGIRDSQARYTMTEAERRLFDARARFDAVREGRNPYRRDGKGLTAELAARAEKDYRRWLETGGQIYTK